MQYWADTDWAQLCWGLLLSTTYIVSFIPWHYLPGVVGLVQVFVDKAMVQEAVDPVDAGVSESNEGEAAQYYPRPAWGRWKH